MFRTKGSTQQPTDEGPDATAGRQKRRELGPTDDRPSRGEAGEPVASEIQCTAAHTSLRLSQTEEHPQDVAPPAVMNADLAARLDELLGAVNRTESLESALDGLSARCRELAEAHHEQNTLMPVFLTLIGVADSHRERLRLLQEARHMHAQLGSRLLAAEMHSLCEVLRGAILDVEAALANQGVERYEKPAARFDPTLQTAIKRIPTPDTALHGRVAARVARGYQRGKWIVRPERVDVYVPCTDTIRTHKGAQQ